MFKIANNCYNGDQIEGMTASQCNVLELGLIFAPFFSTEKFVVFNY